MSDQPIDLLPLLNELYHMFEAEEITVEDARQEMGLPRNMNGTTLIQQDDPMIFNRIHYTVLDQDSNIIRKFFYDIDYNADRIDVRLKDPFLQSIFAVRRTLFTFI